MITEKVIRSLIDEKLGGSETYLVDLSVSSSNQIKVELDRMEGVSIDECVAMSRHIESALDRETEDLNCKFLLRVLISPLKFFSNMLKILGEKLAC